MSLNRPAVFDGKKLVRVSTCPWHPKYQAKRAPRSDGRFPPCSRCLAIWDYVESLASDEPVVL